MYGTAIVRGKVLRFRLPPVLVAAHKRNTGKSMSGAEAIEFVENKRRETSLRRAKPYLEARS